LLDTSAFPQGVRARNISRARMRLPRQGVKPQSVSLPRPCPRPRSVRRGTAFRNAGGIIGELSAPAAQQAPGEAGGRPCMKASGKRVSLKKDSLGKLLPYRAKPLRRRGLSETALKTKGAFAANKRGAAIEGTQRRISLSPRSGPHFCRRSRSGQMQSARLRRTAPPQGRERLGPICEASELLHI